MLDKIPAHICVVNNEGLHFLFGEPRFVRQLDPERTDKKAFNIEDRELHLTNRNEQKRVARACANWIECKAEIRSVKKAGFLHGKLYHIQNPHNEHAIWGSSNFTVRGLGLATSGNNIELNLEVDSRLDRNDLRASQIPIATGSKVVDIANHWSRIFSPVWPGTPARTSATWKRPSTPRSTGSMG